MTERDQIVSTDAIDAKPTSKELAAFFAQEGQLLPMLDLVEQAQCAIGELVDVIDGPAGRPSKPFCR